MDESDAVVVGTVSGIQSVRAPSGDIYSFVSLEALEIIDGEYTEPAFTFQIFGGRVEDEMQAAEGAPIVTHNFSNHENPSVMTAADGFNYR